MIRDHTHGDRRHSVRVVGAPAGLVVDLGLGVLGRVKNWSPSALLVVTRRPVRPGGLVTIRMSMGRRRWVGKGHILRCGVTSVYPEVLYESAVVVDEEAVLLCG